MSTGGRARPFWYRRFRGAAFASAAASLVLTLLLVLPFPPFSYLPPVIVGGGPGTWFVMAYLLILTVGVGGFGVLSGITHTIEVQENRAISQPLMLSAFVLLGLGFAASCTLLAVAGAVGGYASSIESLPVTSVQNLLDPYVYPVTACVLMAVLGAALALYAMARAGWPSN